MAERKRLLFASNASLQAGAGHLRRCIEVANYVKAENLMDVFHFGEVAIDWIRPLVFETFGDLRIVEGNHFEVIVLDSYDIDFIKKTLSSFSSDHILQIADSSTVIIDNAQVIWLDPAAPPTTSLITDRIVPNSFSFLPVKHFAFGDKASTIANRVLVTVGGSPNYELLSSLLAQLSHDLYKNITFEIMSGAIEGFLNEVNFIFHDVGPNLSNIVKLCDTVISASGTSAWDFLANGKVLGLFCLVENQRSNYNFISQSNMAIALADFTKTEMCGLETLNTLFFNVPIRQLMVKNSRARIDRNGTKNFVEYVKRCITS